MKQTTTTCIFLIIIFLTPLLSSAQNFTQTIERTARFNGSDNPANELSIYNIHGSVTVEGYNGKEIRITARQKITGTAEEIKQAREELEFVVDQEDEQILIYITAPFIELRKHPLQGGPICACPHWRWRPRLQL